MGLVNDILGKKILQVALDHADIKNVTVDEVLDLIAQIKKDPATAKLVNDKISPAEIIAALKAACLVVNILNTDVCPLINNM